MAPVEPLETVENYKTNSGHEEKPRPHTSGVLVTPSGRTQEEPPQAAAGDCGGFHEVHEVINAPRSVLTMSKTKCRVIVTVEGQNE